MKKWNPIKDLNFKRIIAFFIGTSLLTVAIFPTPDDMFAVSPIVQMIVGSWLLAYAFDIKGLPKLPLR